MFSKNTYLLPQVSPSFHHPRTSNSLVDINGVEILLHPDVFSSHYLAAANVPMPDQSAITLINRDECAFNGDPSPMVTANAFQRKQTVKKDRHSKIFTSQGPRDRRVRLSIGIARKFFDLQEMLGFDKPSKTLDWLLTKSKSAIKELVQMKHDASGSVKSSSSPSECEVVSCENGDDSKRKAKDPQNLVKESRAKARARARERTREKMCIKHLNGERINRGCDLNPNIYNVNPIQFRNNAFELSGGSCSNNPVFHSCHEGGNDQGLIQESIVIKRKSKNPSFFGFSTSNYGIPSANGSENWDICAILDQHKFINSSSNI